MISLFTMIYNFSLKTWHPCFLTERPLPGQYANGFSVDTDIYRFKSVGHHSTGFTTREDALKSINEQIERIKPEGYNARVDVKEDIQWDGNGAPICSPIYLKTEYNILPKTV